MPAYLYNKSICVSGVRGKWYAYTWPRPDDGFTEKGIGPFKTRKEAVTAYKENNS